MTSYTYSISGLSFTGYVSNYYITGVSVSVIPNNGGYKLYLTGKFPLNTPMLFFVGDTASTADYQCWSGKVGQGNTVYAITTTKLRMWSPRLPVGGPFHIFGYIPSVRASMLLESCISTIPAVYSSCVFDIRSLFPGIYKTGPRRIDLTPPI